MRVLVNELNATAPRPRSPHMNNEEPINLSHYPDGRKPEENEAKPAPIERDDFPGKSLIVFDAQLSKALIFVSLSGCKTPPSNIMAGNCFCPRATLDLYLCLAGQIHVKYANSKLKMEPLYVLLSSRSYKTFFSSVFFLRR